jgi:hypothetical protein
MPATIKHVKCVPTASLRSFLIPPTPLAMVPIVKKDGSPSVLFLVRDEEESHALTRRIGRGLEREGIAAYANKNERRPDTDSWLFAVVPPTQHTEKLYCPNELVRGAEAATALAKKAPIITEKDPSNPVCLICREHCENKWGNSHGFLGEGVDEDSVLCNSCNEHEIYYRINNPLAHVVLLPPHELRAIATIPACACGGGGETEFQILHNRASKPVLLEFNNVTSPVLDAEIKAAVGVGAEIIYVARLAEMEAALADYREYQAAKLASQVAREPDRFVSTAEVKKPSKKERQADSTRGSNAVRDQKKKEREAFEKECERAALAQLAIKKAADEKKRKAKAAKAKVARASP